MDRGWYPDPKNPAKDRYWNGVGWVRGAEAADPPPDPDDEPAPARRRAARPTRRRSAAPVHRRAGTPAQQRRSSPGRPRAGQAGSESTSPRRRGPSLPGLTTVRARLVAVLGVVAAAVAVVVLVNSGGPDDVVAPPPPVTASTLDKITQVFADHDVDCRGDGRFHQKASLLIERTPALGKAMQWTDAQKATVASLLETAQAQVSFKQEFPLRQVSCGSAEVFAKRGGLVVTLDKGKDEVLPVLVYVSSANEFRDELRAAGAVMVDTAEDHGDAPTSSCPIEREMLRTALEATRAITGDYPAKVSDMVGDGPEDMLVDDLSGRWNYSGNSNDLFGKGVCAGYS